MLNNAHIYCYNQAIMIQVREKLKHEKLFHTFLTKVTVLHNNYNQLMCKRP